MKKKVAFLIHELSGGGAERVVSVLSLHLPEEYERHLILYNGANIAYLFKGELISLETQPSKNPFYKLYSLLKRIHKVKRIKKQYRFDIVLSFLEGPNIVNILTKGIGKTVISVRNYLSKSKTGFYGTIYRKLIRLFYNNADAVVVVSKEIKRDLVINFGIKENKIQVIYNPLDLHYINRLAQEELEAEYEEIFKKPVVINVGRLFRQKGQWHLIRAFKKVKEEIPEMNLVILGEGELKDYLMNLVRECCLEENVYFLGMQSNPHKYTSRAVIYAFSSLFEGFPNAMTEAMASSVPVISTDCRSGPREILAPATDAGYETSNIEYAQYGVLVPVCDGTYYNAHMPLTQEEELLAQGIINLYRFKGLRKRYQKMSFHRAQDFSTVKIIRDYEKSLSL